MGENIFDKINQNYFHQIFKTKNKKRKKQKTKMVAWHLSFKSHIPLYVEVHSDHLDGK